MRFNVRLVSSYPERICGIGTYSRDLATALGNHDEVAEVRVAAIDNQYVEIQGNPERFTRTPYSFPVDMTIDRYRENSWTGAAGEIISRASRSNLPTVVIMQHEFGLAGRNDYQNMIKIFRANEMTTLVNMHTALEEPTEDQRGIVQEIADLTDSIIVPTKRGAEILSTVYKIPQLKLRHIGHGIRVQEYSQLDVDEAKKEWGLEGTLVISTIGLKSPDKGIEYGIEAFGEFMNEFFPKDSEQRRNVAYLIGGRYHPDFVKNNPELHKECEETIKKVLADYSLESVVIKEVEEISNHAKKKDVLIIDKRLEEPDLRRFYTLSDIILLPYRNRQQISSGILSDAAGFGKPIIATKFPHALELLCNPEEFDKKGLIGNRPDSRGQLVDIQYGDRNIPAVKQISEALKYLIVEEGDVSKSDVRKSMGENARAIAQKMRWGNIGRKFIEHILSILELKLAPKSTPITLGTSEDGNH